MTASPMPMSTWHADHRGGEVVERDVGGAADLVEDDEEGGRGRDRDQGGRAGADRDQREPLREHRLQAAEDQPADDDGGDAHQHDVGAEGGDAAVGEEQALHEEDDAHAEHGGERADQHRRERAAQEVAAGAGGDREVEHLGGEDERRDQPGHRRGPVVELAAGAGQRDADAHDRGGSGGDRRRRVEESVGHVHAVSSWSSGGR